MNLYGEQSLVNLINHKGHEKPVKDAFEKYMAEVWHTAIARPRNPVERCILGQHAESQIRILRLPQ